MLMLLTRLAALMHSPSNVQRRGTEYGASQAAPDPQLVPSSEVHLEDVPLGGGRVADAGFRVNLC